jgi:hypothetical protein
LKNDVRIDLVLLSIPSTKLGPPGHCFHCFAYDLVKQSKQQQLQQWALNRPQFQKYSPPLELEDDAAELFEREVWDKHQQCRRNKYLNLNQKLNSSSSCSDIATTIDKVVESHCWSQVGGMLSMMMAISIIGCTSIQIQT